MRFRIRPGFKLFASHDDAFTYEIHGTRSNVRPIAEAGDVVSLTHEQVQKLSGDGQLGKYEPLDTDAVAAYGLTTPIVSKLISNPGLYARPPEEKTNEPIEYFRHKLSLVGRA